MHTPVPPAADVPPADQIEAALIRARQILCDPEQDWYPANTFKLNDEFEALGLDTREEQTEALVCVTAEVGAKDYESPEPPGVAAEPSCRGTRMLPFVWMSVRFSMEMFFKFGIHRQGYLYIFSLHKSDFRRKKRTR